jgi:non-ribosomal peptide synthetase component F
MEGLDRRTHLLERRLRGHGIGSGHVVAVDMVRRTGRLDALLVVLRAGATYLALDPAAPAEHKRRLPALTSWWKSGRVSTVAWL